jgi:hypothetical protein
VSIKRPIGRLIHSPGVAVARLSGSRDVEVSYPCRGCDDPGHLAIRFLEEYRGEPQKFEHVFPGYGAEPWELSEPSPMAMELMRLAIARSRP